MCGIAGVWSRYPLADPKTIEARVGEMVTTIRHRGPDSKGVWTDGSVGLGHVRLAIIDLSPTASQPMGDREGTVQLVYNGEVYNFLELRAELELLGYQFRSRGDTEVILNGYKHWGESVLNRLRGMFAFALWDARTRRLLLACDRIGKKPFYYGWFQNLLLFGSEIKAILAWPGAPRVADLEAIHHYLTYQYVPGQLTAFSGIRRLPPAHYMVVEADGSHRIECYWSLPKPVNARPRPVSELKEEFVTNLDQAVRLRLISDVPLGAFLSGGVDSASVVASMARVSNATVKTFTIGFEESDYDERHYAHLVAERYHTEHHEFVLKPNAVEVLPKLVWYYGEPFADPSAVATYYLAELTRRYVTVALNGDGGDESFLGYRRYVDILNGQKTIPLPNWLKRPLSAAVRTLSPTCERIRGGRFLRKILTERVGNEVARYAPFLVYFSDADKELGYGETLRPFLPQSSLELLAPYFAEAPSLTAGAAWADIHTYLPDDLLVKVDIATMAHSLEGRSPLLDHVLMEWAAGIPADQKMWGRETKALVKAAMEPYLPPEILNRPKMGFGVPIDCWLRTDLKEMAYDTLLSQQARARGLFKESYVRHLLDEHCQGIRLHHTRIWALLMLELWYRMWIDPPDRPVPPDGRTGHF